MAASRDAKADGQVLRHGGQRAGRVCLELAMKCGGAATITLASAVLACGDDEPRCAADQIVRDQRSALCLGAHELAKRSTTAIVPSQAEIEEAERLIERAFQVLRPGSRGSRSRHLGIKRGRR